MRVGWGTCGVGWGKVGGRLWVGWGYDRSTKGIRGQLIGCTLGVCWETLGGTLSVINGSTPNGYLFCYYINKRLF